MAKLLEQAPHETDRRLLASLKQRCGLHIEVESHMVYPETGGFHRVIDRVVVEGEGSRKDALSMVELAMTPAPKQALARELTRLRILTKAKDRAEIDTEFEAQIWLDELSRYPADVAVETLREWPRRKAGTWWPSWHELEPILRRKAAMREALAAKLRQAA